MSESRLVPSNLMSWPRTRDLLPDQKLVLYHLWATCKEACGCCLVDFASFQGALNITQVAISELLKEFERRKILAGDEETGEFFILDWFRFHKFENAIRKRLLLDSLNRIQSDKLIDIVNKSIGCSSRKGKQMKGKEIFLASRAPATTDTSAKKDEEFKNDKLDEQVRRVFIVKNQKDIDNLTAMIESHGREKVLQAASEVQPAKGSIKPYVSTVYSHLHSNKEGNQNAKSNCNNTPKAKFDEDSISPNFA